MRKVLCVGVKTTRERERERKRRKKKSRDTLLRVFYSECPKAQNFDDKNNSGEHHHHGKRERRHAFLLAQ